MFIWCLVLFGLGVSAFLDSQFNYGYVFRSVNSVLFMLVSLGLLVRTRVLSKYGYKEQLPKSDKELVAQAEETGHTQMKKRGSREEVSV